MRTVEFIFVRFLNTVSICRTREPGCSVDFLLFLLENTIVLEKLGVGQWAVDGGAELGAKGHWSSSNIDVKNAYRMTT